jgi:hypothetical protein
LPAIRPDRRSLIGPAYLRGLLERPANEQSGSRRPGGASRRCRRSAPIQAGQRWYVERTNAWQNAFNRLQCCYERTTRVIDAFFDLADAIITLRSLIRQARITYRWDTRPTKRP